MRWTKYPGLLGLFTTLVLVWACQEAPTDLTPFDSDPVVPLMAHIPVTNPQLDIDCGPNDDDGEPPCIDDQPGQKDVSQMGGTPLDGAEPHLTVFFSLDETQVTGGDQQTCATFDVNDDGFTNYSLCVRLVAGDGGFFTLAPSVAPGDQDAGTEQQAAVSLWQCDDAEPNPKQGQRCNDDKDPLAQDWNGDGTLDNSGDTNGSVNVHSFCVVGLTDDPFEGLHTDTNVQDRVNDTGVSCTLYLEDLEPTQTDMELLNVCTHPTSSISSDPSDCIIPAGGVEEDPSLTIEKSTNGADADAEPGPALLVGADVTWTYVVMNTGNVALSDVLVTDDQGVDVTCPATELDAGASMTCTASGTATADQYANIGTAEGTSPGATTVDASDPSHYFGEAPSLSIEKATNGEDADAAPGPTVLVDDPVSWEYVVTNTGNVALSNVSVTDDQGVVVTCPQDALAVGESMTCTASGTATLGQYTNLGTASGTSPGDNPAEASDPSNYFGASPGLSIEKSTNGEDADEAPGPEILVGQTVTWAYVVTNTGNVALSNVSVSDDQGVDVTCPANELDAGASMTCTASGTATADQYTNIGTASGTSPGDNPAEASDPSNYFGADPSLDIEKSTNGEDADDPTGPEIVVDETVSWEYVVTNTGNVALSGVSVSDDQGVVVTCPATDLEAGASMTCTATGTATLGQYANLGTGSGDYSDDVGNSTTAGDDDLSHYLGVENPSIDIEKFTNGQDVDAAPGSEILVGETVEWTYVVTNTGNVPLSNVSVSDDQGVVVTCPQDALAVGESMTCTASGPSEAGQYENTGSASGTSPGDATVGDTDSSYYFGAEPSLSIEKSTNGEDADDPTGPEILWGETVTWEYVVENTGNVALSGVSVSDDQGVVVSCPATDLEAGASMTCTATGTATLGQYANLGTGSGDYSDDVGNSTTAGDDDRSHYLGVENPSIDIEKFTNGQDVDSAPGSEILVGETVEWTYVVTNTGNVPLSNVSVSDDQGVVVTCPQDALAVGESMTCTASGPSEAGQYENTGSASGTSPGDATVGDTDSSYYFGAEPSLSIEKSTNGEDADDPTGPEILVDDPVTWEYVVENTGNVALSGVSVSDDQGVDVTCPTGELAVNESMTCTARGTATLDQYANLGTGSVVYSDDVGNSTTKEDVDPSHYFGADPSIDIEKFTNGQDVDAAPGPEILVGETVTWTYVVENTGNVVLSGVSVSDDQGVSVSCPQDALDPGESMTCTASGQSEAGQYENTGSASGTSPGGTTVDDDDHSYYFGANPSIDIEKSTNEEDADDPLGPFVSEGNTVEWTYVVTNTGNVALNDVSVSDDQGVVVTCPTSELAVGESITCQATGAATLGQYANLGTVSVEYFDDVGNSTTNVTDVDPSHYYGLVDRQASIELRNLSFTESGGVLDGTFEIWDTSDPDLPAIGVTFLTGIVEVKQVDGRGQNSRWREVDATCTFEPDAPFVFTDWASLDVDCTITEPLDPDLEWEFRLTVEAEVFNRRNRTFRITSDESVGGG